MTIQDLIDRAGGIGKLADRLGVARASVYDWRRAGRIPLSRAIAIELKFHLDMLEVLDLLGLRDGGNKT